jgi:tRNA threonylcarbamoyladenosine biosynthesis protein TsaE
MIVKTEAAMISLGERLAAAIKPPALLELVGDVGVGKTTLVKGLARGLGVTEEVTSPSFTINKQYSAPNGVVLSHYDFYRLPEAGIMAGELAETLADPHAVVVVEWAEAVQDVLPSARVKVCIIYNKDGSRQVTISGVKL